MGNWRAEAAVQQESEVKAGVDREHRIFDSSLQSEESDFRR